MGKLSAVLAARDHISGAPASLAVLPAQPTRQDIEAFQAVCMEHDDQSLIETRHHFAPGMYGREMRIKAGTFVVGARHHSAHLVAFAGDMTVWTEGGESRLLGVQFLQSLPGAKRVGYAHTDSVFTTYHHNPDDCHDLAELERRYVTEPELLQHNRAAEQIEGNAP